MKTMTLMCGACASIDRARLDRAEDEAVLRLGAGAETSEAAEILVGRRGVGGMRVAALRIRLPDLDHRVGDRHAGAVEHLAGDLDPLARHDSSARSPEAIAS